MPVEQSLREVPVGDNLAPRAQSSAVLPAALRRRGETLFYAMILPVTAAAIWQAVALMHLLPPMLFPSVGRIAATTLDTLTGYSGSSEWYSGQWYVHALASTGRVLIGFLIGGSLGAACGMFVGMFERAHKIVDPSIHMLRPIPVVAWIPLAVAWFGIGNPPAVFLIALGTFFPTYLNARHGVTYVDPVLYVPPRCWDTHRDGRGSGMSCSGVRSPTSLPACGLGLVLRGSASRLLKCSLSRAASATCCGTRHNFLRIDLIITGMMSIAAVGSFPTGQCCGSSAP